MREEIIIIGGGAAGMMAAYAAASQGAQVRLLERNRTLGRKLLITGSGRCNLTNDADQNQLITNVPGNGRFLYSAFKQFSPADLMQLLQEDWGVPLKVERGRRVFPVSDRSQDILAGFERGLKSKQVQVETGIRIDKLLLEAGKVIGVSSTEGRELKASKVIITTGGSSYPGTGSSGDGYRLAKQAGHSIQPLYPALVPLETKESWPKEVEGLSLTNINVIVYHQDKQIGAEFGDLLFTGFGVSGPTILTLSRSIAPLVSEISESVSLKLDLKPALTKDELDHRVQRDFAKFTNKLYRNALDELLPRSLIPVMIGLSSIDPEKPVHQITKEERHYLVQLFKGLPLTITKPRPMSEAIVTQGGVNVKEVDPKTMASKFVEGLFFAGEVLDVDAYTGGYNLQIAFSTGYVAGLNAAQ